MKIFSTSLPSLNFAVLITASADEVCDARNDATKLIAGYINKLNEV